MVSVCMITYNHELYIQKAIEGVLMQQTNFKLELIIGEDCSTDRTFDICQKFAHEHPEKIILLRTDKNLGMMSNFIRTLKACKQKYIALCEGDDYWTDPLKLQKQVDFLEANPAYGLCFHRVKLQLPDGSFQQDNITKVPPHYERLEDLARYGNYIHTPSVMFKPENLNFPKQLGQTPIGDFFLYMLLARQGKIGYIDQEMAVYRTGVGMWSQKSVYERSLKTAYTFALLVDTDLFTEEVNAILKNRISGFIHRFNSEIKPSDVALLQVNKEIEIFIKKIRFQKKKSAFINPIKRIYHNFKNLF